ncbi:MAG: M14 family metallocarboxypeptidase [Clostridiales bacterium]|nr:M14 family metallocarboxypeptidase [Clostridiales bacterium]
MRAGLVDEHVCDYAYLTYCVDTLSEVYPFLHREVVGYSWEGRRIYALSIGNQSQCSLYHAATHGCEWLTSLVLLRFVEELCASYRSAEAFSSIDVAAALEERGAMFLPCVNPDGVQIHLYGASAAGTFTDLVESVSDGEYRRWNANARGVDINHNFDAGWETLQEMERAQGICGPAPRQYGGKSPESELETHTLTKLCRSKSFRTAFALHAQGEEIYYLYGDNRPRRADLMAKILSASSGYRLADQEGLASHGGFKDWFVKERNRPAFTIELGRGENPLPLEDFPAIYEKVREMFLLGMLF